MSSSLSPAGVSSSLFLSFRSKKKKIFLSLKVKHSSRMVEGIVYQWVWAVVFLRNLKREKKKKKKTDWYWHSYNSVDFFLSFLFFF